MTQMTDAIRDKYGETARSGLSSDDASVAGVAKAFGYTAEELSSIPAEANMGLSCGNPIAMASIKEGEVVVDLGSGGGLDVFLAAGKVGSTGKAIGIDMTPDMIELATKNAQKGPGGEPYTNVEFKLGRIDALPLEDASVDVIISNCVINLAPDKSAVFREMFRVLKPGGRVAVSDIALKKEMPAELSNNVAALVGCIAGAIPTEQYQGGLTEAGFSEVAVVDTQSDLTAYAAVDGQSACCTPGEVASGCCSPSDDNADAVSDQPMATLSVSSCCSPASDEQQAPSAKPMHKDLAELLRKYDVNEFAASCKIFALKPE